MQATMLERLLGLATDALSDIERGSAPLTSVIQKALRLARLRNDHEAVFWLSLEVIRPVDKEAKHELLGELSPRFTRPELAKLNERYSQLLFEERKSTLLLPRKPREKVGDEMVMLISVPEMESRIAALRRKEADPPPPTAMHPFDVAHYTREWEGERNDARANILQFESVMSRVRQRVHAYLSRVEKELVFGQLNADIFERNRRFVDERLASLAPDAMAQLVSAYERVLADEPEARAQGLLSCRRVLKSLADLVYPARTDPVKGADGKMHDVSDEKYISRLWQYVHEQIGNTTAGGVVLATLTDVGGRLDAVYKLSSKGVHSSVNQGEADQALIQTYLLIGDLLRLADRSSAAVDEPELGHPGKDV